MRDRIGITVIMEVPAHLYEWLLETNLFKLKPGSSELPLPLVKKLEDGPGFVQLIKHLARRLKLGQVPNFSLSRVTAPSSHASKQQNWVIISQALGQLGVIVSSDSKNQIVGGDKASLEHVLGQVYIAEKYATGNVKASTKDGGVFLEAIDRSKVLSSSESCLEFLILSFCQSFDLTTKQAAGLLTQNYHYLAHVVVKGLKNEFEPIVAWLQEVYANTDTLMNLLLNEEKNSLRFILEAIKPGLISKDPGVVQWAMRLLAKFALDLHEQGFSKELWEWFTENALAMSLKANNADFLLEMLVQVGQGNLFELFAEHLQDAFENAYLDLIIDWLPGMIESESTRNELEESGLVKHWMELCLKEPSHKISMLLICELFMTFHSYENLVLEFLNKKCRSDNFPEASLAVCMLFHMLEYFIQMRTQFASLIYKTLVFLLIEFFDHSEKRELITLNLLPILKNTPSLPVGVLIDPLVKHMKQGTYELHVADIEFFIALAMHSKVNLKQAIEFIDTMGNIYVTNLVYSKASGAPFTLIASRFAEQEAMQEYLFIFCSYCMRLLSSADLQLTQPLQKKRSIELKKALQYQRSLLLEMVSWIIQQWQEELNEKIKLLLLDTNASFLQNIGIDCESAVALLGLFGDVAHLLMSQHQTEEESVKEEEKMPVIKYKSTNKPLTGPSNRAISDIEKARKTFNDRQALPPPPKTSNSIPKKLQVELTMRRIEQGRQTQLVLFDVGSVNSQVQNNEVLLIEIDESTNILLKKYNRPLKVLFSAYAGTGFERKPDRVSEFEWLNSRKNQINESELVKLFTDYFIFPELISKETIRSFLKTYCAKVIKLPEQGYVDFSGFKELLAHIAFYIYSEIDHMPSSYALYSFIDHFKKAAALKGMPTSLYEFPDTGNADLSQLDHYNDLLRDEENTELPDGLMKVPDLEYILTYQLPDFLNLPESYRDSYEVLDEIIHTSLGFHLLEPVLIVNRYFRVKGIQNKVKAPERPPIYKRELKRPIQQAIVEHLKISPKMKARIPKNEQKSIYEQCAAVLEEMLNTVQLRLSKVGNRPPVRQTEKLEVIKERERKAEEERTRIEQEKRAKRQKKLLEQIEKGKEERRRKLQEQELKKQEIEKKAKEWATVKAERDRVEWQEKNKLLKEWNDRRAYEIEQRNSQSQIDPQKTKEMKDLEKKRKEKLERYIQETQKKFKEQNQPQEKIVKKKLPNKIKSTLNTIKESHNEEELVSESFKIDAFPGQKFVEPETKEFNQEKTFDANDTEQFDPQELVEETDAKDNEHIEGQQVESTLEQPDDVQDT